MKYKKIFFLIIISLFSGGNAFSTTLCSDIFQQGIQGHPRANPNNPASDEMVTIECGSKIVGSGPSLLVNTVNNPTGCSTKTCNTANCTASGNVVPEMIATFQSSTSSQDITVGTNSTITIGGTNNATTDYDQVTVGKNGTLNFSSKTSGTTLYRINSLSIRDGSVVNLEPGDYYINTLTRTNNSGTAAFTVQGTGTARVFINNSFNSPQVTNWNAGGSASQLFIYTFNDFNVSSTSASTIKAVMYVNNDLTFNRVNFAGAIVEEDIYLTGNSTVTYDSTAVANMNFGSACSMVSVTKFAVNAPSTGTNCQNMTITVTAQNASNQTVTNYTGAITLTTQNSSGTWVSTSGAGTFSSGSNGTATYTFAGSDNGTATFQLSYPSGGASPMTVQAYQTNNSSINGFSSPINFIPSGILVTGTAVSNPPASPPPAFSTTQTSGNNFTLYLTAYNSGSCGVVTSYTGVKTLRFYTTYVNPTSGTINMTINGINIANSSSATQTTQSITFTNGVATVSGNYKDVGKLMLNVIDTSIGGPSGASGNFIVVPAQFAIQIPNNNASQTTSPSANAVSACLANSAFQKAGVGFTVNVQAQNLQGTVTPNFGNEITPEGVLLQSGVLLAPAGGRNGSTNAGVIANGSAFSKVTGSGSPFTGAYFTGNNFSFDEVGCINLTASIASGNYLGGGGNVTTSTVVGRFTPSYFSASGNAPQFGTVNTAGSQTFTYLNQTFNYVTVPVLTVAARSAAGTTTQNYTGSFWMLSSSNLGSVYNKAYYPVTSGDTIPTLTFSGAAGTPIFVDNANGTGTYTFSGGSGFQIQKGTSESPPLTAEIQLRISTITDSDNIICSGSGCSSGGYNFGLTSNGNGILFSGTGVGDGKQFLHGRLDVIDAVGSGITSLTIPMQTQYYTSKGFVLNTFDSNTTFTGGVGSLVLTSSTGLSTTAALPNPPTFNGGILNITFSAPNSSGTITVQANCASNGANLPWLQYAWPSSTNNNPIGQGTFGVSEGNPRIIYSRENVP